MSEFVENGNEEVVENTTMETMEDALDSVKEIKVGDTVVGDVLAFDDNQVRVSIQESGGLEGVIPRNELSAIPIEELTDVVNIGDEVELVVVKPIKDKENGNYLLSKKRVDAKKVWAELEEKAKNDEVIEAPVKNVVKGGLVVDLGVRGFVPASMVEDYFVDDFSTYVGKELKFKIVEIEPNDNRLILSHKDIARAEREAKRAERLQTLEEGSIIEGTVARIVNFGAFIDLDGVDGLVHISRIAHEHVAKPSDYLTPGETVKVKVLSVDLEEGRVSLSIKDTLPGPWDDIEEKAGQGAVLKGTVKRLTDFGAFVEVFPGVEGLVHISQISHEHIATPADKLEEGQEIDVKVLSVDPEEHRLSLSIKALEEAPARSEAEENEDYSAPRAPRAPKANKSNNRPAKPASNKQAASSDDVENSFTMGDLLGSQLSGLDLSDQD
ncbi:30S ribosomal protein S1 [Eremococcus coleocola]|uniref:30S ribosomal protein S1 n=1 Tax=Eremococcus coleocola ACS-139-V-Col8 TaxID=908337 RepID=E4KLV5_9LACT|nr:30S ribosomal protein S1 [Eremococcus coleocola]EFR31955.1 30S ribosomal protein S1 [Eremococcus coleocola ACS-139-V-Col8]